jgi:hypothetical protein
VKCIQVIRALIEALENQDMQIYLNEKIQFRLKTSEHGQFNAVMKKEGLNKSDTARMLYHLGIKAYLENQERAGRQLSADEDFKPSFTQQEALIQG